MAPEIVTEQSYENSNFNKYDKIIFSFGCICGAFLMTSFMFFVLVIFGTF